MCLPELIIVGAAKSGTTALWYNLDKHPDIYMARKSASSVEMKFWKHQNWKKGFDWYKEKFKSNKMCGEKCAGYYVKKQAFREMKKYIPDAKLFFCVRNPVDRAYSHFQMNYKSGRISSFDMNLVKRRYGNNGKYIKFIEHNMLPFFDKDQIHICVTEHMKENPTEEMKKVFEFLGVSDLNYPKKIIGGTLLKNRSRKEDIKLSHKEKFYRVWSKHTGVLTGKPRKELLEYYKPHNERLFEFLGYEIKEWNK